MLASLAKKFKFKYISVFAFSLIINLLMLVPSWYMLQVYDRVLTSHDENTLLGLSVIAIFIYVIYALLERARGWILIEIAEALDFRLSPVLHRSLLSLRTPAALRENGGLNDLNTVKQFLTGQPMLSFLDAPWIFIYLVVIFYIHPDLGWLTLVSMVFLLLLALFNQRLTRYGLERSREFSLQERKWISNVLAAQESIHALGMKAAIQMRLAHLRQAYLSSLLIASGRGVNLSALSKWVRTVIQSAMLGYGAYLTIHNEITAGMIIAGTILLGRALAPIDGIINSWKQWSDFRKSLDTLSRLVAEDPERNYTVQLGRPSGHLTLDNVTVRLRESGPPALQNITMQVLPGQTVAIIGPSGAGKTTLLKTLAGILLPSAGRSMVDGADLVSRDESDLGPYIGYLGQETGLLAARVSENISRFKSANGDAVLHAAKRAGAHEMLMALPEGYETLLGDRGAGVSEGQKRRIALARALYGDPAIVLLDEPGTALDEQSAVALSNTLNELKSENVTVVFTTHQPGLLRLADVVVLLVDGQIRLMGPRDEVLERLTKK